MKHETGKIDIAFILILIVILVILLYVLAPQNIRVDDPGFLLQYWRNITQAFSNIGLSISNALQSLGQGITNLFANFGFK